MSEIAGDLSVPEKMTEVDPYRITFRVVGTVHHDGIVTREGDAFKLVVFGNRTRGTFSEGIVPSKEVVTVGNKLSVDEMLAHPHWRIRDCGKRRKILKADDRLSAGS